MLPTKHNTYPDSMIERLRKFAAIRPDVILRVLTIRRIMEDRDISAYKISKFLGISKSGVTAYLSVRPTRDMKDVDKYLEHVDRNLDRIDDAITLITYVEGRYPDGWNGIIYEDMEYVRMRELRDE